MRIARVLLTKKCNRDCDKCCNKDTELMSTMRPIRLEDLTVFNQVILTGGEPMLFPRKVRDAVSYLRAQEIVNGSGPELYLYTALFTTALEALLPYLSGVHFSLHYPLEWPDLCRFYAFQEVIKDKPGSFRLYIEPRIEETILINPSRWNKVEVKPWLDHCPLPPGEELYELVEEETISERILN